MNNRILHVIFLSFLCLTSTSALGQTVVWDEVINGDFPGNGFQNNTEFQDIQLVEGINIIKGTANNANFNGSSGTFDAYSFTVPDGASITTYDVTVTIQNDISSDFFAYEGQPLVYNDSEDSFLSSESTSLLPIWGGGTLLSGDYGLLMAASGEENLIYEFSINCVGCPIFLAREVPTLSEWGLIVLALMLMICGTLYLLKHINLQTRKL